MRLTVILTAVLILLPTLARADDSDGPKKVLFAVSSAGSMSTVFGSAKDKLKKSVDRLTATDQVGHGTPETLNESEFVAAK